MEARGEQLAAIGGDANPTLSASLRRKRSALEKAVQTTEYVRTHRKSTPVCNMKMPVADTLKRDDDELYKCYELLYYYTKV